MYKSRYVCSQFLLSHPLLFGSLDLIYHGVKSKRTNLVTNSMIRCRGYNP